MTNQLRRALALAGFIAGAIHSINAQTIGNGGFEVPEVGNYFTIRAGETTLAPWVVGGLSVDVVGDLAVFGPAFEGSQYLDLDGTPGPGQIMQPFTTTPGLLYTLTFAYANNYAIQPSASATVRIFDGQADRLNQTITHSSSQAGNLDWTLFTGQFVALANSTSLEFMSLSAGGDGGIFLDAVAVQVVPEPNPLALLLVGAACAFWLLALRTRT